MPGKHRVIRPRLVTRKRAVIAVVVIVALAGTSAGVWAWKLASSMRVIDADSLITAATPTETVDPLPVEPTEQGKKRALTYIVLGSDSRDGDNNQTLGGGNVSGMRSDTTLIVQISKNRDKITAVSIPRDSWVDIPSCKRNDGSSSTPATTKFNHAFSYGGAKGDLGSAIACTASTVQHLTGLKLDGYALFDMAGFEQVVDALGGVTMDIPDAITSRKAGNLVLKPGRQKMNGKTATQYARARIGDGLDGSDISRIQRQQELFGAIVTKAKEKLTDPLALNNLAFALTANAYVSKSLSPVHNADILAVAWAAKDADIEFVTVPNHLSASGNDVLWDAEAKDLWAELSKKQ